MDNDHDLDFCDDDNPIEEEGQEDQELDNYWDDEDADTDYDDDGPYDDEEDYDDEPSGSHDLSDDADALASAGFGTDEDYGGYQDDGCDDFFDSDF